MSLEELEVLRKNVLVKYSVIIVIGAAISAGILVYDYRLIVFALAPIILGFILATFLTRSDKKKFSLAYKDVFVRKALDDVFDNLTYKPDEGLPYEVIDDTHMIYMGDEYYSNDYVSGYYKGIRLEQADVNIVEVNISSDSDGGTREERTNLFLGRWMIFDFNKDFKANIQVKDKWFSNAKLGNSFKDDRYQKIEMEDSEFNKMFKVNAQDEHDAFYVLTPSMMLKMKNLKQNVDGRLMFCFIGDKLHVALANNKDSFEHSIFKKINPEEETEKISGDIKLITDFVDGLSLDNDIFK